MARLLPRPQGGRGWWWAPLQSVSLSSSYLQARKVGQLFVGHSPWGLLPRPHGGRGWLWAPLQSASLSSGSSSGSFCHDHKVGRADCQGA